MRRSPLPWLLGAVIVLFIGILVATYVVAREANPVILDEHGNPRDAAVHATQ